MMYGNLVGFTVIMLNKLKISQTTILITNVAGSNFMILSAVQTF